MKSVFIIVMFFISNICICQVPRLYDIKLKEPGTIMNFVDYNYLDSVIGLTINGQLNNADFRAIKKMKNLKYLDISNANIIFEKDPYAYINFQSYENYLSTIFLAANKIIKLSPDANQKISKQIEYQKQKVDELIKEGGILNPRFFNKFTSIESIKLPKNIKIIGDEAFSGCTNLREILLPDSLISLGNLAFSECENLCDIKFPSKLYFIGYGAFRGCRSIKRIDIISDIERLDRDCFNYCRSLKVISIKSVNEISTGFICDCDSLTEIHCQSKVPPIASYYDICSLSRNRKNTRVTFYFPKESVTDYVGSDWADFFAIKAE